MRQKLIIGILGIALLIGATATFGLWGEFDNEKPWDSQLPKEVVRAVNSATRVHGEGGNVDLIFCFRGEAKDVNQFLATLSETKDVVTEVILIPEKGEENHGFGNNQTIACDWSIRMTNGIVWQGKPPYYATVNVYCGDRVKVESLKLPMTVEARVGGTLAHLVKVHQARRVAATETSRDLTTMKATDNQIRLDSIPRGLFAAPTTNPDAVPAATQE